MTRAELLAWIADLPPDAIAQVVRAYTDAEYDGRDESADRAFRDALASLVRLPTEGPQ